MVATTVLSLITVLVFLATPLNAQTDPIDVKAEARAVVANVRDIVTSAKEGAILGDILQDVLDLQNVTLTLLVRLPAGQVSECETQNVIKMAAAGIGSHEVMGVMLAEGDLNVLSARLGLTLAFADRVAQLMEDKLSLSSDVGPELTALVFGTNTTASVINRAGGAIQEKINHVGLKNRIKPRSVVQMGRGFDIRNSSIFWKDTKVVHAIRLPPWDPSPWVHHVAVRSPQGWSGGLRGLGDLRSGSLAGDVGWTSRDGRVSAGLEGGFGWGPGGVRPDGGFRLNIRF